METRKIWLPVLLILFTWGCGAQPSDSSGDRAAAVLAAMEDEEFMPLLSTEIFVEDDGTAAGQKSSMATGQTDWLLWPRWYREITHLHRDVEIHIESGLADVEVRTERAGRLHLDVDGDGVFGLKTIQSTARRYLTFKKMGPWHWALIELSPVEVLSSGPVDRTVQVEQVTVSVDGEIRWEVSDPETRLPFPAGLPIFSPGEEIIVTAKIRNEDTDGAERESVVYLHQDGRRKPMVDDGLSGGDQTAWDGVFTRTERIGPVLGFHHSAVDALDAGVFSDETTENYNAAAWGMPYVVALSYTGTIFHSDRERHCWKFVTDDGAIFEVRGGSPDLYQNGVKTTLMGFPRMDLFTTCGLGPVLRVISFTIEP